MAGLWEFPTVEIAGPGLFPEELDGGLDGGLEPLHDLFSISHGITKHRIKARVRQARSSWRGAGEGAEAAWFDPAAASDLALTGMAKKVLARLEKDARQTELFGGEPAR